MTMSPGALVELADRLERATNTLAHVVDELMTDPEASAYLLDIVRELDRIEARMRREVNR